MAVQLKPVPTIQDCSEAHFISAKEVADLLRIGVPTVHVYIRRGIIPAYRFGDVVRIPRKEFATWLDSVRVIPVTL